MIQIHVPKFFFCLKECYLLYIFLYIINQLPSRVLIFKPPLEALQNQPFDLSYLTVFSCTCFEHAQASNHDKLDLRVVKCIFLGYSSTKKRYKCYHPPFRKLFISRDVQFEEATPYYDNLSQ